MKDVQAMLRRIDEELTAHRQTIAVSRVKIGELEETRRILMGLSEDDQAAAEARKGNGGLLEGSHAKPVLIVRKISNGAAHDEPKKKRKHRKDDGSMADMKARILKTLEDEADGLTSHEIGNHLGLGPTYQDRNQMSNALYQMKTAGILGRHEGAHQRDRRYYRPVPQ